MSTAGTRMRAALAVVTAIGLVSAAAPTSQAQERDPYRSPTHRGSASQGIVRTGGVQAAATSTDLTPTTALQTINAARARYGTPALTLDTSITTALNNHARYASLNAEADDDLYTEEPSRPGYTASGAEIAPYAEPMWTATLRGLVDGMLGDPALRTSMTIEQTGTSVGFGAYGDVRVFAMQFTGEPPAGYPRSFPRGANNTTLAHQVPWMGSYGCTGRGFPVTAGLDYTTYGLVKASSGRLLADGVAVSTCTVGADKLPDASLAMVPATALKPGTHYTGSFTASANLLAGGSRDITIPVEFTTAAAQTGIAGDQSGDRMADVFTVNQAGELFFYKGRADGTLGHGWKVGHGWGTTNWLAMAGDLNRDGRSDLLARRTDGTMWLYTSRGMGQVNSGLKVGYGFQTLSELTVVGDMNRDGVRDLVGRTKDGLLKRYSLEASRIRGSWPVGHGWNTMSRLLGAGSFNGDAYSDLLAIDGGGLMWAYISDGRGGLPTRKKVGHGWTGYTPFIPGDYNGDGRLDMTARDPKGQLWSYRNMGTAWGSRTATISGFSGIRLFA